MHYCTHPVHEVLSNMFSLPQKYYIKEMFFLLSQSKPLRIPQSINTHLKSKTFLSSPKTLSMFYFYIYIFKCCHQTQWTIFQFFYSIIHVIYGRFSIPWKQQQYHVALIGIVWVGLTWLLVWWASWPCMGSSAWCCWVTHGWWCMACAWWKGWWCSSPSLCISTLLAICECSSTWSLFFWADKTQFSHVAINYNTAFFTIHKKLIETGRFKCPSPEAQDCQASTKSNLPLCSPIYKKFKERQLSSCQFS